MNKKTILSLEQALTLPYATQRFVHLGWRVIRLESSGAGDPNRYVGDGNAGSDLHSYFVAPNVGKEAITINLKEKQGRELLLRIIRELKVDIFMCNTLPMRYKQLGIDYDTLKRANPNLIWCGISALGPDYPDRAGYDPALQALTGYMHLTGEENRDPMLCGLPIIDLKAGDEAFTQVVLAILDQQENPVGKEIHISMAQCASSWLITTLPQLGFTNDPAKLPGRCGNEHRNFIPTNCYPTADGFVYLAIGSDIQWKKLGEIRGFEHVTEQKWSTNEGRRNEKHILYEKIREGLKNYSTSEFISLAIGKNLAVSPVNSIQEVAKLEYIKNTMVKSKLPSGKEIALFPPPVNTEFLKTKNNTLKMAPHLGENNEAIFKESGLTNEEITMLHDNKLI